jgi:glyceraldehyde 3-phosphate dehydrogenase
MTKESINEAMKKAAQTPQLKGKLQYNDLLLVSSDMIGNPHSSIFDATMTTVISENMAKVFSWYDNEWGFSNRMVDFLQILAASK